MGRSALSRGASRLTRIANWLRAVPPPEVTQLRLAIWSSDASLVLWQWTREDEYDVDELARAIDVALQDYAEEQGSRVEAKLFWIVPPDREWIGTVLKAQPSDGGSDFEGTSKSLLVQEQRHKEAVMQVMLETINTTCNTLRADNESLRKAQERRDLRAERIEVENEALRREVIELKSQLAEAESVAETLGSQLDEAISKIEELKKQGGSDAEIISIAKQAFTRKEA